eukprot:SAG11_NODE_445_length_9408_cov_3.801590_6_plen_1179_part_00
MSDDARSIITEEDPLGVATIEVVIPASCRAKDAAAQPTIVTSTDDGADGELVLTLRFGLSSTVDADHVLYLVNSLLKARGDQRWCDEVVLNADGTSPLEELTGQGWDTLRPEPPVPAEFLPDRKERGSSSERDASASPEHKGTAVGRAKLTGQLRQPSMHTRAGSDEDDEGSEGDVAQEPKDFTLRLYGRLWSAAGQAYKHFDAITKGRGSGAQVKKWCVSGESEAQTPNCAVDRLTQTVPLRVVFRLRDLFDVDLVTMTFKASLYLELQWVEGPLPPPTKNSELQRSSTARFAERTTSKRNLLAATLELQKLHPAFVPELLFENLVESESKSLKRDAVQQCSCSSVEQLQRFWALDPSDVTPTDYTLLRLTWSGTGVFRINPRDVREVPIEAVQLKINLRYPKSSCKIMQQETMSSLVLPKVVPLQGRLAFHHVDVGESLVDTARLESSLGAERGSLSVGHSCKIRYTVEEVQRRDDAPSLELSFVYRRKLDDHRLGAVLPYALLGSSALSAAWSGSEHRGVANAVLLGVGLLLGALANGGSNSHKAQPTMRAYIGATCTFIWFLGAAESIPVPRSLLQLLAFCTWLVPTALLCSTRTTMGQLLRCGGGGSMNDDPMGGMQALVEVVASLLHTHWRHERASSFSGTLVPRWKMVSAEESKVWLASFDEAQRDALRGVLFAEVPGLGGLEKGQRNEWLGKLQAISDGNRVGDKSGGSSDKRRAARKVLSHSRQFRDQKRKSTDELTEWLLDYAVAFSDQDPEWAQHNACTVVDINNDYHVLPPSWQEENRAAARGTMGLLINCPNMRDQELSDGVHEMWLERNDWARSGPLGVPFEQLPIIEQAKDLSQVVVCRHVLDIYQELRQHFDALDTRGTGFIAPGDAAVKVALNSYGVGNDDDFGPDCHSCEAAQQMSFVEFVEKVVPDVEARVAQQLFGVDMVSLVAQIRQQQRGTGEHSPDVSWRTVSDDAQSETGRSRSESRARSDPIYEPCIDEGRSGYHIFISYRRTGVATARHVKQALNVLGYRCFMDFEALTVGDFQKALDRNLQGTPVVVVIMTPGAFTTDARWPGGGRIAAKSPGQTATDAATDWMQHEIAAAQRMRKLIVPVRTADFDLAAEFHKVPEDVGYLQKLNIIELSDAYYDASIMKIIRCIEDRGECDMYVSDEYACDWLANQESA